MYSEAKKYFKYLGLIREDIREEFDLLGVPSGGKRICDFGCGNGITTFGLALEASESECIGIDLFDEGNDTTQEKINQHVATVEAEWKKSLKTERTYLDSLYQLIKTKRVPQFVKGNIVLNKNLPQAIDLAYCKKLLINLSGKKYRDTPSGQEGLLQGLKSIRQSLRSGGWMCVIEYDQEYELEKNFENCNFQVVRKEQIKRREIRSRGRTKVMSWFTLYLCQKPK